jgi:hypothetical protein
MVRELRLPPLLLEEHSVVSGADFQRPIKAADETPVDP